MIRRVSLRTLVALLVASILSISGCSSSDPQTDSTSSGEVDDGSGNEPGTAEGFVAQANQLCGEHADALNAILERLGTDSNDPAEITERGDALTIELADTFDGFAEKIDALGTEGVDEDVVAELVDVFGDIADELKEIGMELISGAEQPASINRANELAKELGLDC